MLISQKDIRESQKKLAKISLEIERKSRVYYLVSDPTRLKILLLLKIHEELCPTDFSKILNISIGAVSHQLKLLERADLVKKIKIGKIICYSLPKNKRRFLKNILK